MRGPVNVQGTTFPAEGLKEGGVYAVKVRTVVKKKVANGLKWRNMGDAKLAEGDELNHNVKLCTALEKGTVEFTEDEWKSFGVKLQLDSFIKSGATYFAPSVHERLFDSDFSEYSSPVQLPVLDKLTQPRLTLHSGTELLAQWSESPHITGCRMTKYELDLSILEQGVWNQVHLSAEQASTAELRQILGPLEPGGIYALRVHAVATIDNSTSLCESDWSDWSEAVPLEGSAAPVITKIRSLSSRSGVVRWKPPSWVGRLKEVVYELQATREDPKEGTYEELAPKTPGVDAFEVLGLRAGNGDGTTYTFRLRVYDPSCGISTWSEPSKPMSIKREQLDTKPRRHRYSVIMPSGMRRAPPALQQPAIQGPSSFSIAWS
eukprot:7380291-Prymnesium_polylepis.1